MDICLLSSLRGNQTALNWRLPILLWFSELKIFIRETRWGLCIAVNLVEMRNVIILSYFTVFHELWVQEREALWSNFHGMNGNLIWQIFILSAIRFFIPDISIVNNVTENSGRKKQNNPRKRKKKEMEFVAGWSSWNAKKKMLLKLMML